MLLKLFENMDTAELEKNSSSKQSIMIEVKILVNKIY